MRALFDVKEYRDGRRSGWLYFCPHCGVEYTFAGYVDRPCPICGNKNPGGRGYSEVCRNGGIDYTFAKMKETRIEKGIADPEPLLAKFGINCDYTVSSFIRSQIESIRENPQKLKTYIIDLFNLEGNIISLRKHLADLYVQRYRNDVEIDAINNRPKIESEQKLQEDIERFDRAKEDYRKCLEKHRKCLEELESCKVQKPTPVVLPLHIKPVEPVYQQPGLFNKKKILAQNEALERNYKLDLQEYERNCQQRLIEMEKRTKAATDKYWANVQEKEQAVQAMEKAVQEAKSKMESLVVKPENYIPDSPPVVYPEKAKKELISAEIEKAESLLKNMYQTRYEMYATDIVYRKYRDIVALATFYEYLLSGRCSTLEGPNGAYNLYESEIRANLIISKLSEVEKSLKKIEQSQYMIYSQLTEMNKTLSRINGTLDVACGAITDIQTNTSDMTQYMAIISQNSAVIAHNTAVNAYYSKMNAELTDALGFMVAFK